jgi:hypothetical protein
MLRLHRDSILAEPRTAVDAIRRFLGGCGDAEAMAAAVRPERNRHSSSRQRD